MNEKIRRLFNVAGTCIPAEHYLLPTLVRCPEIGRLIESKHYFVVHVTRQAGKTTLITVLRELRDGHINRVRSPFPVSLAMVGMRNIHDYGDYWSMAGRGYSVKPAGILYSSAKAKTNGSKDCSLCL